jgi:penicillin-binding protein 2A
MDRPKSFRWTGEPAKGVQDRQQTPAVPAGEVPISKKKKPVRPNLIQTVRRRPRLRLRWKPLLLGLLGFIIVVSVLGTLFVTLWIRSLDINKLAVPIAAPTQLLDIHGKPAAEISTVKNEPVPISQVPKHMREAVVAVEDRRFYDHTGVDFPGILRAAFRNVRQGATVQGGSTITQQLAKNVFTTGEKTLSRKLTEAAYAVKIESSYDKDRILEMYLNQIYFGEGQWGIQRAAKRYFGKDTKDLTLAESALLAALPKAPSRYTPFRNPELALERRNLVLGLMKQEGFISEAEYAQARAEPIRLTKKKASNNSLVGKYASFADVVIDEAIEKYGLTERELMSGNLHIYTTLDPKVQSAMEKTFKNDALFPSSAQDQIVQSGAVILNPHTGGIRGIVGQRGEHVFRGFNHATHLKRQPGSTFKPIMVYGPALEKGYRADSVLQDAPLNVGGYQPRNSDGQTRGPVSLHDALIHSWNIPAVWLLNEIGVSAGIDFATRTGIPMEDEEPNLGLALGGMSGGVSPLQMAQAFSVFPALGQMSAAHSILKITDPNGKVLAVEEPKAVSVTSSETAYAMTEILQDAVQDGTGKKAALPGRPTAGKTGTTQLPFEGVEGGTKDAWFVGYTPEMVGAVWMGYDETDTNHYLTTSGGQYPAMVFQEMMSLSLQGEPVSTFRDPAVRKDSGQSNDSQGNEENQKENGKKDRKGNKKEKGRGKNDESGR